MSLHPFPGRMLKQIGTFFATVAAAVFLIGPADASTTVGGGVVGSPDTYDYSPSVLQSGGVQQFFWCAGAGGDKIAYEEIQLSPLKVLVPETIVLQETAGTWDSAFTCNPHVVRGTFVNPLGNGTTYTYALYYVATNKSNGTDNSIGVAFSNDALTWVKYPAPVIQTRTSGGVHYGAGQPDVVNTQGANSSAITMVYEYNDGSIHGVRHFEVTSTDGVHFSGFPGSQLTTAGLQNTLTTLGDLAYDPAAGMWYGVYDQSLRAPATTGGFVERGQMGVQLYRIPAASLLSGSTPWTQLDTVDTNMTGYESNFIGTILRDPYGNVQYVGSGSNGIELYYGASVPAPAANASPLQAGQSGDTPRWDIAWSVWYPSSPLRPLQRYYSSSLKTHEVTTGWVDTSVFSPESPFLGSLFESPQQLATQAIYSCKDGTTDYFLSLSPNCENSRVIGLAGYAYGQLNPGVTEIPLYRCYTGTDHFVSTDPNCEGTTTEFLLGYSQG